MPVLLVGAILMGALVYGVVSLQDQRDVHSRISDVQDLPLGIQTAEKAPPVVAAPKSLAMP